MKRTWVIPVCIIAFFSSCGLFNHKLINQEIPTESGKNILVGKIDRKGLENNPYGTWFSEEYKQYNPDEPVLSKIIPLVKDKEILIFLGTWCSDSRREVPRFYKILDRLKFREKYLTVVGLDSHPDRRKTSPQGEEKGWNIDYVPTIIILDGGKEMGRIVESPLSTLEKDLLKILEP